MKIRLLILLFLIVVRFVLGYIESGEYQLGDQISITGNTNKTYQNSTNCIVVLGKYLLQTEGICAIRSGVKIRAIGTVKGGLITKILGKISLVDGQIYNLDKSNNKSEECRFVCKVVYNFREVLLRRLQKNVPEPETGLVAGIVLGDKKDIGREFYQEMINSGTVHIAVASGYNVMLVGGTVLSLCFWIWKRKTAAIVAILVMMFFAELAGGGSPVIRAVLMAGLVYVAQAIGRTTSSLWMLCLVGWAMIIWDPYLIVDVSFQLSMAASLGMIMIEPWMTKRVELFIGEKITEVLAETGLLTSLSTMMTTAPIIWWHFGRLTWIGIVSNLLILPLVPILMIFASGIFVFGSWFSVPVYALAHFMVGVIRFLGS